MSMPIAPTPMAVSPVSVTMATLEMECCVQVWAKYVVLLVRAIKRQGQVRRRNKIDRFPFIISMRPILAANVLQIAECTENVIMTLSKLSIIFQAHCINRA